MPFKFWLLLDKLPTRQQCKHRLVLWRKELKLLVSQKTVKDIGYRHPRRLLRLWSNMFFATLLVPMVVLAIAAELRIGQEAISWLLAMLVGLTFNNLTNSAYHSALSGYIRVRAWQLARLAPSYAMEMAYTEQYGRCFRDDLVAKTRSQGVYLILCKIAARSKTTREERLALNAAYLYWLRDVAPSAKWRMFVRRMFNDIPWHWNR